MVEAITSILVLTGAGISAESGVETFRDADGIWSRVDYRDVTTPEGFARDPALVHAFYNERRRGIQGVEPNPAHEALARLEAEFAGTLTLVTQNIDDLHEKAGSRDVVHMHGELNRAFCLACGTHAEQRTDLSTGHPCPACGQKGGLRPDIVWFGEIPYHMDAIEAALAAADLFVSIGTSGAVYPAAGFVSTARATGIRTVEINLEPSDGSHLFDDRRHGKASILVPRFVDEILAR